MRKKSKFYNRYDSLFKYQKFCRKEVYDIVFVIPKSENFRKHLENISRLLQTELGGIFEIVFWDERRREIDTNIPVNAFEGVNYHLICSQEESEKLDKFWRYKRTKEKSICKLW